MKLAGQQCGTCRYRIAEGCHLSPPFAQALPVTVDTLQGRQSGLQTVTIWPPVQESDWCGQWAPVYNMDASVIEAAARRDPREHGG